GCPRRGIDAHDAVESMPTIAWNRCPSSVESAPSRPDITTNLVISTDRRTYLIELRSGEKPYMPSVSWSYPQVPGLRISVPDTLAIPAVAARNYRYGLTGDTPPWRPVSVYDDGHKVYVEFPRGIVQGEFPPLFVIGPEGEAQIANTRVYRNILIVDRLFGAAELRLGSGKHQQTIRIVRTSGVVQAPAVRDKEGGRSL
ncbi:TrbG/VirB9 family P-type conjugative transfer protein, partial [Camelimonas lactis]